MSNYNGIIIFGEMGSGKDTLADFLCEIDNRSCKYNLGDVVRQFYKIVKVNSIYNGNTRSFGQKISDALRSISIELLNDYTLGSIYEKYEKDLNLDDSYKSEYNSKDFFSKIKTLEIPIIVGGRNNNDFEYWTNLNFLSVGIRSDRSSRFERLIIRDGSSQMEVNTSKHNTELGVSSIINNKVEILIDNNKDLDFLKKRASQILTNF